MNSKLESFIGDLRILDGGDIQFRGDIVHRSAEKKIDRPDALEWALTECVYKYFYTHPDGSIDKAFRAEAVDQNLIAAFSKANATLSLHQTGWTVRNIAENGSVIASRFGMIRKFMPGQFLVVDDVFPLKAGSEISIIAARGARNQQEGFYHAFSTASLDMAEQSPTVRLYFNVSLQRAPDVVRLITSALNNYKVVFTFKIATRICDYSRTDNAVLYIPKRMFHVAALALSSVMSSLEACLLSEIPSFTKRLAAGIGFAEDPGGPGSFGSSRSAIVAKAILVARVEDKIACDVFHAAFKTIVSDLGLRTDALFLNPGSEDIYTFETRTMFGAGAQALSRQAHSSEAA